MKIQQVIFLVIFPLFCSIPLLKAQAPIPTNEDLLLAIDPQESNGLLTVKAHVTNLSTNTYQLQYQLTVIQKNSNYARNRQKNAFVLDSMATITLGNINVGITSKSVFQIKLEIFQDTSLISYMEMDNELEKSAPGSGLIIDESKTKNGHDFFDLFNKQWMAAEMETNAMIRIQEKPLQLRSTQVLIYINDNLLVQQRLLGRYEQIKEQADYVYKVVLDYLQRNPALNQMIDEEDLKGNGLK